MDLASSTIASWVQELLGGQDEELPCLVYGEQSPSRKTLRDRVAEHAKAFAGHGIGPDSTVALQMPPSFTYLEVLLALWQLGAQVMLLDHRLKPAEVEALSATCR